MDSLICITRSLENNAFSVLHYVMVALHYSVLHRFEIFLPLEESLESIPVFLPVRSESRASHQSGYRRFFHCPDDINVRMRKVLARALSYSECVRQL